MSLVSTIFNKLDTDRDLEFKKRKGCAKAKIETR